ncbi:hypothetical protein C7T94_17905 [Pedobacter yulinensis]|uniref:HMA domain-containing protein n=1 Tax=Pedobacter yulinensis TaxID=2126353 RepID=A0A2T3HHD2_9SPHI|nr:hypothetical protein [Pedobacter yulinensis]PST81849.1 hypothetical protein C7T94_17905 [Pedobacter yulinensis]
MNNFDHILVFKTDLASHRDVETIRPVLDAVTHIEEWNVDLYDEDFVLRIVSPRATHQEIIELVQAEGYACAELK